MVNNHPDRSRSRRCAIRRRTVSVIVFGNSYTDLNSSFADYIFKELGIVDPTEGK